MKTTWATARAWRLRRHFLSDERGTDVAEVVGRLTTVPAWSGDPELAVALRLRDPRPGAVGAALAAGTLIRTYAFGGATHLMRPDDAGAVLALRASGRQWERKSWQSHYRLRPDDWPELRAVVRDALAAGPLTRPELAAIVTADPRFEHLGGAFTDASHTFLKPFAWQGDLVLGPMRGAEVTLQGLAGSPGWSGIPDLDDAGRRCIVQYLAAYGPAPAEQLQSWFGEGLSAGRKNIDRWVNELGDRLTRIDVDGAHALALSEHVDDLRNAQPDGRVDLLPGHDQWVRGPGTADTHIVPAPLRPAATKGMNLVHQDGLVRGTWKATARNLEITWGGDGPAPTEALRCAAERVTVLLGRPDLDVVFSTTP
ncbi:MAG: crosslink repair DNA glycosylase YcaQ family protein [Microbacterium pygmaeum]